jgi:CBS domain-containing protein
MFDLPVRKVMDRKRFLTAAPNTSITVAAQMMSKKHASAIVVVSDHKVIGIFTEHDALYRVMAAGRDPKTTLLSAVMTPAPKTVEASRPFGYALYMMHKNGFRHVPVTDKGKPIGIVSSRMALDPELEEFTSEVERRRQYANSSI